MRELKLKNVSLYAILRAEFEITIIKMYLLGIQQYPVYIKKRILYLPNSEETRFIYKIIVKDLKRRG